MGVPGRIFAVLQPVAERPTQLGLVGFRPPAVQFGEVEPSVDEDLHPARPAGFPGSAGRIDPEIDASDEPLCHRHVVIVDEDN